MLGWKQSDKPVVRSSPEAIMHYANIESPVGPIHLLANSEGLEALFFDAQIDDMETRFPSSARQPGRGNTWLMRAEGFAACSFAGDLDYIPDIPLAAEGTDLQREVWHALTTIPPGETRTYGQIAEQVDRPTAARAVGAAVGRNPISLLIPCHRVIGSGGELTGYAGGLDVKRFLLGHEEQSLDAGA